MATTVLKSMVLLAVTLLAAVPSFGAVRKSKLKIVASVPVESRFRKPGEARIKKLPRKSKKSIMPESHRREAPMNVVVQAVRREPVAVTQRPEPKSVVIREASQPLPNFTSRPRTTKNHLSIEMLGRGGLYSFDYDRQLGRSVSMGLGFSYTALRMDLDQYAALNTTIITVPIYGNYYFNDDRHHRFLGTGGVTIVSAKAEATAQAQLSPEAREMALQFVSDLDLSANASVVLPLPVGGAGYEYKSSGGFLARAAVYAVYVGEIQPWAGVALGSHF